MLDSAGTEMGWFVDPYHLHQERYFSQGRPTKLVRDHGRESFDPPPDLPLPGPPVPAPTTRAAERGASDLHRADECERETSFDRRAACDTAVNAVVRHGIAG